MWMKPLSLQTPVFAFIPEMQVVWIHSFFFFFPPFSTRIPDTKNKIYSPLFHFSLQISARASMVYIMWLNQHWPAFLSWPSWKDTEFLTHYCKWTEMLNLGVCSWLGTHTLGPLPRLWTTLKLTLHPHVTLCPWGELCMLSTELRK